MVGGEQHGDIESWTGGARYDNRKDTYGGIRGTTKVGEITKKVQERRFKWYGHVMRREEHYVGRRAMVMKVQGRRKRGRTKRRWLDKVKDGIKGKGLSADDVSDRATWRRMSSYIDPT